MVYAMVMIDMNKVIQQVSSEVIKGIYKVLDNTWNELGEDVALAVNDSILIELVGFMVLQELTAKPTDNLTPKQQLKFTEANYLAIKSRIQDCIAGGFEAATREFSGLDTQYYCQVKRIPPGDKSKIC